MSKIADLLRRVTNVLPRLIAQLRSGLSTKGEDCGPSSASVALDYITEGRIRAKGREDQQALIRAIRSRGDVPKGATNLRQLAAAIEAFAPELKRLGLQAPRVTKLLADDGSFDRLRSWLSKGRGALVAISYQVVNELKPSVSGSRSFMGYHSIFVFGWRVAKNGGIEVRVWDPLADGRVMPNGQRAPEGPQWWPLWLLERAAAKQRVVKTLNPDGSPKTYGVAGEGRAVAGLVNRAKAIAQPQPEPEPEPEPQPEPEPPTCEQRVDALKADNDRQAAMIGELDGQLDRAAAEIEAVDEVVADTLVELRSILTTIGEQRQGLDTLEERVKAAIERLADVQPDTDTEA